MSTEIWSANATIGTGVRQVALDRVAIKRLPLHILLSDPFFIKSIKLKVGDVQWKKLPVNKATGHPDIKISYLGYLGVVAEEPVLPV